MPEISVDDELYRRITAAAKSRRVPVRVFISFLLDEELGRRNLHRRLDGISRRLDVLLGERGMGAQALTDSRGTFLPGSGWISGPKAG